jgi:CheY-like chemotaxis protein
MADATPAGRLRGKAILVVEDEYVLASDLEQFLLGHGAIVLGPAGSVKQALALIERTDRRLDAAVLDINLRGEHVYQVADTLIGRKVPVVLTTGYEELLLTRTYIGVSYLSKPLDKEVLLSRLIDATR